MTLVDNLLASKYGCVVQETFTVQDPPASPSETFLLPPLKCLYKANEHIQERPQPGDSRPVMSPSQHTLRYRDRSWGSGNLGKRTLQSLITTEYFNRWLFINNRQSKLPGFKTLTLGLALTMSMSPYWHMRWQLLNPVKSLPGHSVGNLGFPKPHQASFERWSFVGLSMGIFYLIQPGRAHSDSSWTGSVVNM